MIISTFIWHYSSWAASPIGRVHSRLGKGILPDWNVRNQIFFKCQQTFWCRALQQWTFLAVFKICLHFNSSEDTHKITTGQGKKKNPFVKNAITYRPSNFVLVIFFFFPLLSLSFFSLQCYYHLQLPKLQPGWLIPGLAIRLLPILTD